MKYDPPNLPFTKAERREMLGVTVELISRSVIAIFLWAAAVQLISVVVFRADRPHINSWGLAGFVFLQGLTTGRRMQAEQARIWLRRTRLIGAQRTGR